MTGQTKEVLSVAPDVTMNEFGLSKDNRRIDFMRAKTDADMWMLTLNEELK